MKTSKAHVPKALREVWNWKRAIHDEVKHLPLDEALREIARRAHETAVQYGFAEQKSGGVPTTIAADGHGEYRTCPRRRSKATDVKRNLTT